MNDILQIQWNLDSTRPDLTRLRVQRESHWNFCKCPLLTFFNVMLLFVILFIKSFIKNELCFNICYNNDDLFVEVFKSKDYYFTNSNWST